MAASPSREERATPQSASPSTPPTTPTICQAGCKVTTTFFRVESCAEDVGGGFRPPDGVVLCHNHLPSQDEVRNAMVHELVHAYDHCRGADLDWGSCEHHACSEVRAASLSGDCKFKQEFLRGNFGLRAQHQASI